MFFAIFGGGGPFRNARFGRVQVEKPRFLRCLAGLGPPKRAFRQRFLFAHFPKRRVLQCLGRADPPETRVLEEASSRISAVLPGRSTGEKTYAKFCIYTNSWAASTATATSDDDDDGDGDGDDDG